MWFLVCTLIAIIVYLSCENTDLKKQKEETCEWSEFDYH